MVGKYGKRTYIFECTLSDTKEWVMKRIEYVFCLIFFRIPLDEKNIPKRGIDYTL